MSPVVIVGAAIAGIGFLGYIISNLMGGGLVAAANRGRKWGAIITLGVIIALIGLFLGEGHN